MQPHWHLCGQWRDFITGKAHAVPCHRGTAGTHRGSARRRWGPHQALGRPPPPAQTTGTTAPLSAHRLDPTDCAQTQLLGRHREHQAVSEALLQFNYMHWLADKLCTLENLACAL